VDPVLALFAFAPGLALGSFLNVVAARLPERRSLARGRSECPSCRHELAWYDNVPLLSYVALRGRCRHCGTSISARYLLVELATALLVAGCFARFGLSGEAFVAAFFATCLVVLAAIDAERQLLPDRIVLPATGIVLAAQLGLAPERWLEWTLSALALAGFLFVVLIVYPAGMGMGDVKLALLLGAALGRECAVAMAVALLGGLAVGVVLLARHGAAARKIRVPFGVFMAAGGIVALFAGERLLDAYLGLF
jgi:leader peptidase (prepilin peptidase)/N-methyltransferase